MAEDVKLDWERPNRAVVSEAILCSGKSASQIADILREGAARGAGLLFTKLSPERFAELSPAAAETMDYDPVSRTGISAGARPIVAATRRIAIVAAGSSDVPVAREALRTLQFHGVDATWIVDVGVAGLWRLMARLPEIAACDAVIAVAGMEGALFSVVAGLVPAPVIAVPTSVGYGVAAGGRTALHAALAACAPGVVAVNIDNGFGAACAVLKIVRLHAAK